MSARSGTRPVQRFRKPTSAFIIEVVCSRTAGAQLGREELYQRGRQYLGVNVVLLSVENLMLGTWDRPRQCLGARAWRRVRLRNLFVCLSKTHQDQRPTPRISQPAGVLFH
jgi:hypothetical protein